MDSNKIDTMKGYINYVSSESKKIFDDLEKIVDERNFDLIKENLEKIANALTILNLEIGEYDR